MVNSNKLDLEADAVRLELDRIVSSSVFSAAKRSKMLLRFVVERSLVNSAPKEFEIAVEVLRRGADYDPEIDAAVRVEASRLRSRLREYYDTEGQDDPISIDIPKGGYGAVFASRGAVSRASVQGREYTSPQPLTTNGTARPQHLGNVSKAAAM